MQQVIAADVGVASNVEVSVEGRGREVPTTTNTDMEHVEEVRVGCA
jgi:hypothetical protein